MHSDPRLSGREREVLELIGEGLTSAEIGIQLGIGERTIETYRSSLHRKLGVPSGPNCLLQYALHRKSGNH